MSTVDRSYHGGAGKVFADRVARPGLNSLHDRPAVLDLIGDVAGQRIADLGCGAGDYVVELVRRGADVIGVEGSDSLAEHARTAVGSRARIVQHNLEEPMSFLPEHSQDGVLSALVLHHLSNRRGFLRECRRILRPGGWLVVSTTHPTADWGRFGRSYFDQGWITRSLGDDHSFEYQLMPMSVLVNELLEEGFILDRMVEPQPLPALREVEPDRYDALRSAPVFLALRLHT